MAANVKKLLSDYNVEFVEHGPNVAKGNVNIQCPWCGDEDSSHHLGINLATGMWGCWRSKQHRGRKLSRLLVKLTGLSRSEALRACGEGQHRAVDRGDFENALQSLTQGPESAEEPADSDTPRRIELDQYMRPLRGRIPHQRPGIDYLIWNRGFRPKDVIRLCKRYDLHYAIRGDFADRITVPVYEDGELMTYLGRSIYPNSNLRYRALAKEESVKQVKDCVYNFDHCNRRGRTLYIVEGAFDVFKIDLYNHSVGIRAAGLFNMNVEQTQLDLLERLRGLYGEYVGLLDRGQVKETLQLEGILRDVFGRGNSRVDHLKKAEDPGALTRKQALKLREA